MKTIDFGQTITTVANLGVIGGLIFVGLQLMQDRQIATNAAILDVANTRMYWAELVGQNRDAWVKGLAGEPLSATEYAQFDALAASWEVSHYAYYNAQELLSADSSRFVREWALELNTNPGLMAWWDRFQRRLQYTNPDPAGEWIERIDEELTRLENAPLSFDNR